MMNIMKPSLTVKYKEKVAWKKPPFLYARPIR